MRDLIYPAEYSQSTSGWSVHISHPSPLTKAGRMKTGFDLWTEYVQTKQEAARIATEYAAKLGITLSEIR